MGIISILFVMMDQGVEKELKNFGNRLKTLRKAKGYSNYEHFAYDHNIGRAQYGRYEKGSDIRLSTLILLLKEMNISLADFFSQGFSEESSEK